MVDNKERNIVDLKSIRQISDTCSTFVCIGDDDDFMAAINKFLEKANISGKRPIAEMFVDHSRTIVGICDSQFPLCSASKNESIKRPL